MFNVFNTVVAMIPRNHFIQAIKEAFRAHPIVAILGARQSGKTTLAKHYFSSQGNFPESHYFDLERQIDLSRLENPYMVLKELKQLIVIDEIQRIPELFPTLRVIVDEDKSKKILILGSASRDLIRQSSESLAGRIAYLELPSFSLKELGNQSYKDHFLRGGFPNAYLAKSEKDSYNWRRHYIQTYLEQDIPNLGIQVPPQALRRFWMMLAHYHGQLFNASELGRSLNLSHTTIQRYVDILAGTFMIRILHPWYENLKKRQVKTPKILFRDSGIYHALNGIETQEHLDIFPKIGASWEGYALENVLSTFDLHHQDAYFWSTHSGAELDLLILEGQRRIGFEFKYTDRPKTTKSMLSALENLGLKQLIVITPGTHSFAMHEKIQAYGLQQWIKDKQA